MEIDNQTNDPVDYEQTGSGGGAEEEPAPPVPPCPVTGKVGSGHAHTFVPCGRPPFSVAVKRQGGGPPCTSPPIMKRSAKVVVKSLNPCDIEVQE